MVTTLLVLKMVHILALEIAMMAVFILVDSARMVTVTLSTQTIVLQIGHVGVITLPIVVAILI